jgi:hypothetical protein
VRVLERISSSRAVCACSRGRLRSTSRGCGVTVKFVVVKPWGDGHLMVERLRQESGRESGADASICPILGRCQFKSFSSSFSRRLASWMTASGSSHAAQLNTATVESSLAETSRD